MYHMLVTDRSVKAGYACDDRAGLLFRNGKLVEAVSQDDISNSYYIQVKKGQLLSSKLESGILLAKGAIPEGSYTVSEPGKKLKDFPDRVSLDSPLDAYVSVLYNLANDRNSQYRELASHSLSQRLGDGPARSLIPI